MSAVWDLPMPPSEKLVLLALADWANDEGHCYPSIAKVARKTGVSERTVQRVLRDAEQANLIEREEVKGKGCKYRLTPRHSVTPDKVAPVTNATETPDTVSPNTLRTTISSEAKASSPRARFPTPPGVSDEQWGAFKQQRKKALNAHSYKLVCAKLLKLAEDGWPPGDMIDLAIERGWETAFAPRDQRHGGPTNSLGRNQPPSDGLSPTTRAARDVFGIGASH